MTTLEAIESTATVTTNAPEALFRELQQVLTAHEVPFKQDEGGQVFIMTPYGKVEGSVKDNALVVSAKSPDLENMMFLREGFNHFLAHTERAYDLAWSGELEAGTLAPNLQLAQVVAAKQISPSYIRLTIECPDISRYTQHGMHFRIIRPKHAGRPPVWPTIDQKGGVKWPEGADELHDRPYTIRSIDTQNNRFTTDIFIVDQGVTCKWAQTLPIGETIGLMGPGGGWFPESEKLLIAGDETALPAIARILENLPATASATAFILVPSAGDIQAIHCHATTNITWLSRETNDNLVEQVQQVAPLDAYDYYWFAASKEQTLAVNKFWLKEKEIGKDKIYAKPYWR